jgi:GNAT superfamily N-acetyltransferase
MELIVASDEAKRERDRVAHDAWEGQLTVEQYLAREERLCAMPWARATMRAWLLIDGGEVLASCETYTMDGFVDGARVPVWAVASVFTEERLRRRGHATQLMERLVARARVEGAAASTLFSDVGAPLYERLGYCARPAEDLVFPPAPGDAAAGVDALLATAPEVAVPNEELVVWPTAAQLDWHLERTRVYAALQGRPALPSVGARAGASVACWSVDWPRERLLVLLLAATRAHEAEALVQAARRTAKGLRLREVRLWAQPWPFPGRADLGGDRVARRHSLPMIAPLVAGVRAAAWTQIPRAVWV